MLCDGVDWAPSVDLVHYRISMSAVRVASGSELWIRPINEALDANMQTEKGAIRLKWFKLASQEVQTDNDGLSLKPYRFLSDDAKVHYCIVGFLVVRC